ncbi:hypothetical protein E4U55_007214 [Claviceps digitariae]|nr:hypothetical protein E4U55_007214 [Claviceps digitariae]
MALHLVPPQLGDQDSASNQQDSPNAEPCSHDSSILAQPSTSRPPSSALRLPNGQHLLGRHHDNDNDSNSTWLNSKDMAILKVISCEPCLANCQGQHHHHCIKRLPPGTKPVKLVGEGAANAVFELKIPQRDRPGRDSFKGLLLRVAKVPSLGAPLTYNYLLQQQYLQTAIKPILGEHVVHQELVVLHKSNIVRELNNLLRDVNHTRRDKFKGTYVGETDWGFLIEDMRPQDVDSCVLVEFKPKWLSQSPSAPKDAIRCRQCAMELRNLVKDLSINKTHPERKPCPLALMKSDCSRPVCSPFRMAAHLAQEPDSEFYDKALRRIASHDAIRDLKEQQDIHDKVGPLQASPSDPFFPLAMTLRDCTCFAQIDKCTQSVRIRFGDFDWKDPLVKFERWAGVEAELVNGGFYTSEWFLCGDQFYRPPTLCLLEHGPAASKKKLDIIRITDLKHPPDDDIQVAQLPKSAKIHDYSADVDVFKKVLASFKSDISCLTKHKDRPATS